MDRELLERYILLDTEPHAIGGMSEVFKAYDKIENREVAIKVFGTGFNDNGLLNETFSRELRALEDLGQHESILTVYDSGRLEASDQPFLVLEWAPRTISDFYEGDNDWARFYLSSGLKILEGLRLAYARGISHRDIKPQNILVNADEQIRIADFGIAKFKRILSQHTLAEYSTPFYSPPEKSPAVDTIDGYSFVVTSICCISPQPIADRDDVSRYIEEDLVATDDVKAILLSAIDEVAEARPDNIIEFSEALECAQRANEESETPKVRLPIKIGRKVIDQLKDIFLLTDNNQLTNILLEQINCGSYLDYQSEGRNGELFVIFSEELLVQGKPDLRQPTVLFITDCKQLSVPRYERASIESAPSAFEFIEHRFCRDSNEPTALQLFREGVSNFQIEQRKIAREGDASRFIATCRKSLDTLFEIERLNQRPEEYVEVQVAGRRAKFRLKSSNSRSSIRPGEPRLVRAQKRVYARGEVESVNSQFATVYCETVLDQEDMPAFGELVFDTAMARSALIKQRNALESLESDTGVHAGFRLLLQNLHEQHTSPASGIDFFDKELDDRKKKAINVALSTNAFCVIQGPPGTGKTKLIAELLRQLRVTEKKVLLASQTHTAIDNAIEGVISSNMQEAPDIVISRVGRADDERVSDSVKSLLVSSSLDRWTERVTANSTNGLEEWAKKQGMTLEDIRVAQAFSRAASVLEELGDIETQLEVLFQRKSQLDSDYSEGRISGTLSLKSNDIDQRLIEIAAEISSLEKKASEFKRKVEDLDSELQHSASLNCSVLEFSVDDLREFGKNWIGEKGVGEIDAPRILDVVEQWQEQLPAAPEMQTAFLLSSDVVSGTCVGIASAPIDKIEFDVCVIDEAGKARPTETLVPMVRARRWILVGDSRQLPPFLGDYQNNPDVCDDFGLSEEEQKKTFLSFLEQSLPESSKVFLDTQYRMCKPVGRLISACFYDGALESVRDFSFSHLVASRAIRSPVTWFSTEIKQQKGESRRGESFYNNVEVAEAERILGRIDFAAQAHGSVISVACITPYSAQIDMLERMTDRNEWAGIKVLVGTIDSFQGREADVVVLSLVRSNRQGDLGFLSSAERVNVALSRAREALVIIGDASAAKSQVDGHPLRAVLDHIEKDDECVLEKLSD